LGDDVTRGYEVQILGTRISKGLLKTRGCTESLNTLHKPKNLFRCEDSVGFVGTPATKELYHYETAAIGAKKLHTLLQNITEYRYEHPRR
jgi:hypothetical protein